MLGDAHKRCPSGDGYVRVTELKRAQGRNPLGVIDDDRLSLLVADAVPETAGRVVLTIPRLCMIQTRGVGVRCVNAGGCGGGGGPAR